MFLAAKYIILLLHVLFFPPQCITLYSHTTSMQRCARPETRRVVAIVGLGHVPGIRKYWKEPIDIERLMQRPPPDSRLWSFTKKALFAVVGLCTVWLLWRGLYATVRYAVSVVLG